MIVKEIKACIENMKEVRKFEQEKETLQKLEKLDKDFRNNVEELVKIVYALEYCRKKHGFLPSLENKGKLYSLIKSCSEAANRSNITEAGVKLVAQEIPKLKKNILKMITNLI